MKHFGSSELTVGTRRLIIVKQRSIVRHQTIRGNIQCINTGIILARNFNYLGNIGGGGGEPVNISAYCLSITTNMYVNS